MRTPGVPAGPDRDRKHPGATPLPRVTATKDPVVEPEPEPEPEPELKVAPPPPPPKVVDTGAPLTVTPEPPKPAAPAAPAAPNKPPALVAATAVTKLSGELPALKVNGSLGDSVDVIGKMCIDDHGHVTSAKLKTFPEITDELQRALMTWRYKPYVNNAGQPAPACFAISFHVVFKR